MTSYILELKIIDDDSLVHKYEQAIAKMHTEEYKNNPHKDSGFDIYTPNWNNIIGPGQMCIIDFSIQCAAYKIVCDGEKCTRYPSPFYIYPRSSISKTILRLANNTGIIDSGYRGNLMGAFDNISRVGHTFDKSTWYQTENVGSRLLQICMPDLSPFSVKLVDSMDDTTRGSGGFGSTGQ